MRTTLLKYSGLLAVLGGVSPLFAQPLMPLADEVQEALLPAGVSGSDVGLFGELVYLWKETDGTSVAHFVGDFQLHMGRRRMRAQQAVVWLVPREHQKRRYLRLDMLLWRDAQVSEPAGTVTSGPALFVSLNTSGQVETSADRTAARSSADSQVYQDALRIRQAVTEGAGPAADGDSGLTVIELGAEGAPAPEVRPAVGYQGRDATYQEIDGRRVLLLLGNVYVYRGEAEVADFLELRADAAVVYFAGPDQTAKPPAEADDRPGRGASPDALGPAESAREPLQELTEGPGGMAVEGVRSVEGVYLEGDIILAKGEQSIRAARLYYDFTNDRALILDPVFRAIEPTRQVPVYIRAEQVRQLSATEFTARRAKFTTSEFYTPHYHVGAEELTIVDRTRRAAVNQRRIGPMAGTFEARHTTFNLGGLPLLYWPYARGDLQQSETSIKSVRTGYSSDFGVELESSWELFNVLGLEKPQGFDGTLHLDYFSKRGPAVGVDLDYQTDNSFGMYRGYYINDSGEDNLGGILRDEDPDTSNRGRSTFRHRQFLPDGWQLTLEASYLSDKNFLEEYFEPEWDTGKDQETLLYLKKQVDNWAFTAHLQYRLHDYLSTVERLPDTSFRLLGERIGDFATVFSENRAGMVRYRPADRGWLENILNGGEPDSSGTVVRADTRQEAEFPFKLGDLKVVPFGAARATAWDDSPADGGLQRVLGTYGLRSSYYLWNADPEVQSLLWDVDGLRHVVKADLTAWAGHGNVDSTELYPFDESVERIDEIDGVTLGVRQRFQTRRGGPDRQRTVDLLTLDTELGVFNDAEPGEYTNGYTSWSRPENSISQNYLNQAVQYRINDSTSLASEFNVDLNDWEVDVFDLTYAVERTPRLSYLLGYRFIKETDSNLLGAGMNYKINEKYTMAVREEFDLDRGETAEFDVGLIRKFPRWFVGLTFSLDEIEDDLGVSLSAWPEGLPQAALGSRRFTGLPASTGIEPGY